MAADSSAPGLFTCPRCARQEFVTIDDEDASAEQRRATLEARDEQELDGLRIRQLSALRRATYRSRSYAVVAAVGCAIGLAQLVVMARNEYRAAGASGWLASYVALSIAAVFGGQYFFRRAVELHREAKRSRLEPPLVPPDFSKLGNGADRWKDLEDVR